MLLGAIRLLHFRVQVVLQLITRPCHRAPLLDRFRPLGVDRPQEIIMESGVHFDLGPRLLRVECLPAIRLLRRPTIALLVQICTAESVVL